MITNLTILSYIQSISINGNNICPTFIYLCSINMKSINKISKKDNCFYNIDSDDDIPDRPLTEQEIEKRLLDNTTTIAKNDIYFINPIYKKLLKSDTIKKNILSSIKKKILQAKKCVKDVIHEYISKIIILHDPDNILPIILGQNIFDIKTLLIPDKEDFFIMDHIIPVQKHSLCSISKVNINGIKSIPHMISSAQFHSISSTRDLNIITNPRLWELTARNISWMDYYQGLSLLTHRQMSHMRTFVTKELFDMNPIFLVFPLYSMYKKILQEDIVHIIHRLTAGGTIMVDWSRYSSWSKTLGMYIYKINDNRLLNKHTIETCHEITKLYNSGNDIRIHLIESNDEYFRRIMSPIIKIYDIIKTFLDTSTCYTFDYDPKISYIDISCHLIIGRPTMVMDNRIPNEITFDYLNNPIVRQQNIKYRLIVTNLTDDISLINVLYYIINNIGSFSIECLYIKDNSNLIRKLSHTRGFCHKMFFERCFPKFIDYGIKCLPKKIFVGDMVYIPDLGIVSKIIDVYRRLYDDPSILNSIRLDISPVLIPKIEHRYVTNGHRYEYIQIENDHNHDHSLCCGLLNKKLISVFSHMLLKI